MTMMGTHFTGKMPFKTVYIHGLVRDENNKKMSKSANNGIDPLLLIAKYGTDALRYTLIKEVAGAGQDIRLEYDRKKDESISVEASRNFANKLWNAARFVMMNLDGQTPAQLGQPIPTELSDKWIVSRFNQVVKQTNHDIDNYGLGEAAKGLYEFIWGDFCDWYIELVKSRLQKDAEPTSRKVAQQIIAYILEGILKLLHPFMPHITEEIWQTLTQQPAENTQLLPLQAYPEADEKLIDSALETQFDLLIGTIRTIRNLRAEADIKPGVKITANLQSESESERFILTAGQAYIQDLAKVETLTIVDVSPVITPEEIPPVVDNEYNEYPKYLDGIKIIAITIVALIGLKVAVFVGNTALDIPLFGTSFEIIGLGYTGWFIIRHLLNAEARGELLAKYFPPSETPIAIVTETPTETELPPPPTAEKENSIAGVVGTVQVVIPLKGVVDIEVVRAKLEKSLQKAEAEAQSLSARLSNSKFVDKAPTDVVQTTRETLAEAQKQAEILRIRLQTLS
jgi:valyl-tRNA synthetase